VQEVRWDKEGIVRSGDYTISMEKGMKIINLGQGFSYTRVKKVEFASDGMSYIALRGRWCNIIVLNAHAPTEEKNDDSRDSFYEELEQAFDHFPKYHMKILLGDFNVKLRREDIFKPTIGKESLHEDSNDNGVRVLNFATSKNLVVKSTMFPHRNIHKYT
jgi:exonuclease III